jgi:osmotically-inducible protein OsmY
LRAGGFMSRLGPVILLTGVVSLSLGLGGCAGVVLVGGLGAAAGGGYIAAEERGISGNYNDLSIKTRIEQGFMNSNPSLQQGVTTRVYDGRVLLTGRLSSPGMKAEATRIASAVPGIRALYDELEVGPAEGGWSDAQDSWIATRVRSELILDPDIRSVNYTVDTASGSVYLIGSARSQYELDRAVRIARYVPGVKRVVSYVEIRSGVPVAAVPRTGPAQSGPDSNAPRPQPAAPIEVQKL